MSRSTGPVPGYSLCISYSGYPHSFHNHQNYRNQNSTVDRYFLPERNAFGLTCPICVTPFIWNSARLDQNSARSA